MRRKDESKAADQKALQTINFDKVVLEALTQRAKKEGTSVSKLANAIVRRAVMNDVRYHNDMALFYAEQLAKHEFLRNRAADVKNVEITVKMETMAHDSMQG